MSEILTLNLAATHAIEFAKNPKLLNQEIQKVSNNIQKATLLPALAAFNLIPKQTEALQAISKSKEVTDGIICCTGLVGVVGGFVSVLGLSVVGAPKGAIYGAPLIIGALGTWQGSELGVNNLTTLGIGVIIGTAGTFFFDKLYS